MATDERRVGQVFRTLRTSGQDDRIKAPGNIPEGHIRYDSEPATAGHGPASGEPCQGYLDTPATQHVHDDADFDLLRTRREHHESGLVIGHLLGFSVPVDP